MKNVASKSNLALVWFNSKYFFDILQGPLGCGKTKLIQNVANQTGHKELVNFHRIAMNDQVDGKSLLGSYSCNEVPGQFTWTNGVITKAVLNGDWLLVEGQYSLRVSDLQIFRIEKAASILKINYFLFLKISPIFVGSQIFHCKIYQNIVTSTFRHTYLLICISLQLLN